MFTPNHQWYQYHYDSRNAALVAISLLTFTVYWLVLRPGNFHRNAPPAAHSVLPIVGSLGYFSQPWTFFSSEGRRVRVRSAKSNPYGAFSFNVGRLLGVGLTGERARELFYSSANLNFGKGYALLFGGSVKVDEVKEAAADITDVDSEDVEPLLKRLKHLLKTEHIDTSLPYLLEDVQSELAKMGSSGVTDPFESIYRIVFLLTIRILGTVELAEDAERRESALKCFEGVASGMSASAMLFPWLPTPAKLRKTTSAARLYLMIRSIVQARKKNQKRADDALQYLIDNGDSMVKMIVFILGAVLAGQLNTGINAAWILCWLGSSPEWLAKVRTEVESVGAKYGNLEEPLAKQLQSVPLEAWESEFPLIDVCLKESIRLTMNGIALRYNDKADIQIGDYIVPKDSFVSYAVADVHQNPDIYTKPQDWDPARFLPGREEDQKAKFGYVGWGTGRHPCLGMKFAKLELAMIVSFFIATFEWDVVHGSEAHDPTASPLMLSELPKIKLDASSAEKPPKSERLALRYRKRSA